MTYRVILEAPAQRDALDYAEHILHEGKNAVAAAKWLDELEFAIQELSDNPRRFRVIDEQAHFLIELRQFLHHSHRVIYHVKDETGAVHVLRVYHGHRDQLLPRDLSYSS